MLSTHIKWNCLKTVCQFICNACNLGFYAENSVREHYYKEHKKVDLYHCEKCNQGFAFKSRKSAHKKSGSCPNKNGAKKYPGRIPLDEGLEITFKRRIEITLPREVVDEQEIEGIEHPTPTPIAGQPAIPQTGEVPSGVPGGVSDVGIGQGTSAMANIDRQQLEQQQQQLEQQQQQLEKQQQHLEIQPQQQFDLPPDLPVLTDPMFQEGEDASQLLMRLSQGGIKSELTGDNDDDDETMSDANVTQSEDVINITLD